MRGIMRWIAMQGDEKKMSIRLKYGLQFFFLFKRYRLTAAPRETKGPKMATPRKVRFKIQSSSIIIIVAQVAMMRVAQPPIVS